MKKTEYFTSDNNEGNGYNWQKIDKAIESAKIKRDNFLQNNEKSIGRIDNEDISVITMNNNNLAVVIIKLTYYPK